MTVNSKARVLALGLLLVSSPLLAQGVDRSPARKRFLRDEIRGANSFIPSAAMRIDKYQKMRASPFTFYRATASVYYRDLESGTIPIPASWKRTGGIDTWLQGDLHLQNLGYFDVDGELRFDLNDFDEAHIGPFTRDLIRFLASIFLAREDLGFAQSDDKAAKRAMDFLKAYQERLEDVKGNKRERKTSLEVKDMHGLVKKQAKKLRDKKSSLTLLEKFTVVSGPLRRFDLTNPKLESMTAGDRAAIAGAWLDYQRGLGALPTRRPGDFKIKDTARRLLSGLGSLGVRKIYVLTEGASASLDDDLIFEVKEQRPPSSNKRSPRPARTGGMAGAIRGMMTKEAERVLKGQSYLLDEVDPYSGILSEGPRSYLVRRISPFKDGFDMADFEKPSQLEDFLEAAARAIASAHARADKDAPGSGISTSFEKAALEAIDVWPKAKTTLVKLARAYAEQVRVDLEIFRELLADGELP